VFLVKDAETYVFTNRDPREDGFDGKVQEGVTIEILRDLHQWPEGAAGPEPCLGASGLNESCYKVFKYPQECQKAGFRSLGFNIPQVYERWSEYRAK